MCTVPYLASPYKVVHICVMFTFEGGFLRITLMTFSPIISIYPHLEECKNMLKNLTTQPQKNSRTAPCPYFPISAPDGREY